MIEQILDLCRRRGCQAEVYRRSTVRVPVSYENNKLHGISQVENSGIALRVISGGRIGTSMSTRPDSGAELVEAALSAARFGPDARFEFAGSTASLPQIQLFDPAVADLDLPALVSTGRQLVDAAREAADGLLVGASVARTAIEVTVATTGGFAGRYRKTQHDVAVSGNLTEPGSILMDWRFQSAPRRLGELDALAARLIETFTVGRKTVALRAGRYPVLLRPRAVLDLVRPIAAVVNGRAVEKGISPWRDKVGQRVASEAVTVWDDGTLDWASGSSPFDDEGTPCRKQAIIERGVLRSFVLDRQSAAATGAPPTGNGARASLEAAPAPGFNNIVWEPGDPPSRALLRGIREGVLIDSLVGTFAGNPYGGAVSGTVQIGYKIENGELTGRVKDVMFAVNAFDVLQSGIAAISSDGEWVGTAKLPHLLLDGVHLAAKA